MEMNYPEFNGLMVKPLLNSINLGWVECPCIQQLVKNILTLVAYRNINRESDKRKSIQKLLAEFAFKRNLFEDPNNAEKEFSNFVILLRNRALLNEQINSECAQASLFLSRILIAGNSVVYWLCSKEASKNFYLPISLVDDEHDKNLAMYFHRQYAGEIFICGDNWYSWDSDILLWKKIKLENVHENYLKMVAAFCSHLINLTKKTISQLSEDSTEKKKLESKLTLLRKFSKRVCSGQKARTVVDLSKVYFRFENFSKHCHLTRHLLPTAQGEIINLKTGEVGQRTKYHFFTSCIPVAYFPDSHDEYLFTFLNKICQVVECDKFTFPQLGIWDDDEEKIKESERIHELKNSASFPNRELREKAPRYCFIKRQIEFMENLQILLGYSITGEGREQKFFMFKGEGSTGKSTLINLLETTLGEYFVILNKSAIVSSGRKQQGAATPELGRLDESVRVAAITELDKYDKLDESRIKGLSGQDTMSKRDLFKSEVTMKPMAKFIAATNYYIKSNDDFSLRRRIRVFPFGGQFVDEPTDGQYKLHSGFFEKYLNTISSLQAFLSWLVDGAIKYYQLTESGQTLQFCERVMDATRDYFKEQNLLELFIEDIREKEDFRISSSDLYRLYFEWFSQEQVDRDKYYKMLGHRQFSTEVKKIIGESIKSNTMQYLIPGHGTDQETYFPQERLISSFL